ncbi:MAG: FecR domain-containing protein [Elusimicrobia bacterium]|nr:FecR domain-containing protein [Elusimicrobiota bacterium]
MKKIMIALMCSSMAVSAFAANAIVTDVDGSTQYSRSGAESSEIISEPLSVLWTSLTKGVYLQENDVIKTGPDGKASLVLDTGSQIDIGPSSKIKIAKLTDTDTLLDMSMGELTSKVEKLKGQQISFKVKTPASVCAVRGTRFSVIVDKSGKTRVNVFAGVVSAREISGIGEEIYIRQNQFLEILPGVAPGQAADLSFAPTAREVLMTKAEFMNEVRMDMTKEQVQAAAAVEIKNAEYEQGKTMVDYFGKRVRIEEYIVRPQSDQFKFVALNERDNRFDYFTWLATFNTDLPADLSVANQIAFEKTDLEKWTSAPDYWIKQHDCAASNTVDSVEWTKKRTNWDVTAAVTGFKIKGTDVLPLGLITDGSSASNAYDKYSVSTLGGVYSEEYYFIDDEGDLATRADYTNNPSGYNEEMVFKHDNFGGVGGKIDIIVEPKIFEQAGMR